MNPFKRKNREEDHTYDKEVDEQIIEQEETEITENKKIHLKQKGTDNKKKNLTISILLLLGLLIFVYFAKSTPSSPIVQNTTIQNNSSLNPFITPTGNTGNLYKKLEYAMDINVDKCVVSMIDKYVLNGEIVMDIPNFTYSIEVYSINGEQININTNIDPYSEKLKISFVPSSLIESPFFIVFIVGVDKVEYYICKNPQIVRHKIMIDPSSIKIDKVSQTKIVTNISFTIDDVNVKLFPSFKDIFIKIISSKIQAKLYAYRTTDTGIYELRNIVNYTITNVRYEGDNAQVEFKPQGYFASDPDSIYILKLETESGELSRVVKLTNYGNLVTLYPTKLNDNSIEFTMLNPYNLQVKLMSFIVIYKNGTSQTLQITPDETFILSIKKFDLNVNDTSNIRKIIVTLKIIDKQGKEKMTVRTFTF